MRALSNGSSDDCEKKRIVFRRIEGSVGSLLLVIGAAASIGWLVVELYVKAVTMN